MKRTQLHNRLVLLGSLALASAAFGQAGDTTPPAGSNGAAITATEPAAVADGGSLDVELSGAEVRVDVVGDSVIIYGVEDDVRRLEMIAKQLDEEKPSKQFRVIKLQSKNAQEVATVIEQALQEMIPRDPRPEETIAVQTIGTNILLVTGPEERLASVEAMVSSIDQYEGGLPEDVAEMTFPLQHIKAREAATQLEVLIDKLRARQGEDPSNEITIIPLDASNSLLVLGPVAARERINKLINQIDVEPQKGFGDLILAYFPLLHSEAGPLSEVLNELFESSEGQEDAAETIRRLRMLKSELSGEITELPPINLERQIRLIPDDETNALICATAEENVGPLRELIELLDSVPLAVEQSMRIFPLVHADATGVKELLEEMFDQGKELPRQAPGSEQTEAVPADPIGKSLVYNVSISADARTNTVIVAGRPEQLALIEGILQKVDVASLESKHPLTLITLSNIDATRAKSILESLWDQRLEVMQQTQVGEASIARERVFFTVDLRSNALIASASVSNIAEIRTILEALEAAPNRYSDQIRIITCKVTSAADLKTKIDELWQRKADLRGEAEQPQDLPVIVADQRSNALVIASSPEDYAEIKQLIETLEAQPLAPIAEIRLLSLLNNDASQIGDMLQQLFEERIQQRLVQGQQENPSDRVAIASESATNTLLVASSPENFEEIKRIVEQLDIEPDLEGVVQIIPVLNAQAENVANKIQELFDKGLYTGVVLGDSQINEQRQRVAMVADPRSNSVIASASKTNLGIIKKLIEQMDTDEAPLVNADTRMFTLQFADVLKIKGILDELFDGMAGDNEDFSAPTIVSEPTSNTLIVIGSRDAIKRSIDLLSVLDVKPDRRTQIRVYALEHGSAVKLSTKMQEIFDSRDEGADVERTPVFLLADELTNSIIVSAAEEDQGMVTHLIGLLDVPSNMARQVQVFPLKRAKAEPTAESLQELFDSQAATQSGDSAGVAVQADRRTNALIVWASQTEMENIASIVNRLDTSEPGQEMMVKVVPLKRAIAEELAETLLQTLTGGEDATGDDAPAVVLSFEEELDDGSIVERKLFRQDITIEPDPRTNALFVMAPKNSMAMLESLIISIDRIPPTVAEIRMFPLANADAEEVVEVLQTLFEEETTGEGPETRLQIDTGAATAALSPDAASAPGQQLRFTANRRTNMVIAAGSEADLDMIESLVRQLDSQDVEDRIQFVYPTRYVPAVDLVAAIREYFEEENGLLSDVEDEQSIMRQAERHVTVVGDEDSNSVLLGVSPRYYSRTMEMLYAIDRPPPQVVIKVLIAEVQLDDRVEFGMEWALQDLSFSKNATVGPNGIIEGDGTDFVGGTDVGAAGAAGSFGGFTFSITGEDFNFLLRALQSDGSLEVLSRPQITVENNEEANITIGDEVPFLRGSQVTDNGQVNSQVEYEDVGIIVDVTPHINPDGYVNLEIRPEISSLNEGSSVQISENLTAPTFSNRSVETVVTVKDGETVVIGGLIQTQEDLRENKVPILGDIPYIGNLFRATINQRRRTELLVVLSVDVINDERDFFHFSQELRDESGFMPEKMKRSPLMEGLRILPPEEELDLEEAFDPTRPGRDPDRDRDLFGPAPDVYGPQRPVQPVNRDNSTTQETYGPPRRNRAVTPVAYSDGN